MGQVSEPGQFRQRQGRVLVMEGRPMFAGHQAVEGIDKGLGRSNDDVRIGGVARIKHPTGPQPDGDISHGIDAFGNALNRKFHQFVRHLGQVIECLADRIHRTGANAGLAVFAAILGFKGDGGRG